MKLSRPLYVGLIGKSSSLPVLTDKNPAEGLVYDKSHRRIDPGFEQVEGDDHRQQHCNDRLDGGAHKERGEDEVADGHEEH